jgi:hypothetical protein
MRPEPGGFKRTNEDLDSRNCSEADGNLLGAVLGRTPVHNLNVKAWKSGARADDIHLRGGDITVA